MILLRLIGFFFVVAALYSMAAVVGSRSQSMASGKAPSPKLWDLSIVLLSWIAALATYFFKDKTGMAAIMGAGLGALAGFVRYRTKKQPPGERSRVENWERKTLIAGVEPPAFVTPARGDTLGSKLKLFFRQAGGFQSRVLLYLFYFLVIMPFGIMVGKLGDPLRLKAPSGESFWKPREPDSQNLAEARRQS